MNFVKPVLISAALGVGLIGAGYLIAPRALFAMYEIPLESVNALNMIRSAYGGLFLGFAYVFGAGAMRPALERPALVALLAFMGGFALGRLASIVVDGLPGALIFAVFAVEVAFASFAAYLLRRPAAPLPSAAVAA